MKHLNISERIEVELSAKFIYTKKIKPALRELNFIQLLIESDDKQSLLDTLEISIKLELCKLIMNSIK